VVDFEALLQPIDEERPAGADIFYEDDFAEIENLRELTDGTPARGPAPDHAAVVERSTEVLQSTSKDLRVALYLAEASLHTDGFEGFATGLELVVDLLIRYQEDLHPQEPEDRAYALDFLEGGLSADSRTVPEVVKSVELYPITVWQHHVHHYEEWKKLESGDGAQKGEKGDDSAATAENFGRGLHDTQKAYYKEMKAGIERAAAALEKLEELGRERFAEVGFVPRYQKLKSQLGRVGKAVDALLAIKLERDPDPVEAEAGDAGGDEGDGASGGEGADGSERAGGPGSDSAEASARAGRALAAEPTDEADAAARIEQAARFLRAQDPTDPAPYLLLRGFRWGELRRGGNQIDLRLLEAPETRLRTRLKTLLLDESWEELVEACEEVMAGPCGRGWLDLQRYLMTALDNLGSSYGPVAAAIRSEIDSLLDDLPQLLEKTLMDDTPTANQETKRWLDRLGVVGEEGEEEDDDGPDYDGDRILAEATHERALEWAASGNPRKGIELLKRRSEHEDSERARFITESLAASVMVEAGMVAVARPLLEDLAAEIESRKLEEWEPAAVLARPLGLLYRALPPNDRRRDQLYDRICRLDPVLAISLEEDAGEGSAPPTAPAEEDRDATEPSADGPSDDS